MRSRIIPLLEENQGEVESKAGNHSTSRGKPGRSGEQSWESFHFSEETRKKWNEKQNHSTSQGKPGRSGKQNWESSIF